MRNHIRRLFSAFLALALLLTMLPPAKAADETIVREWSTAEDYSAWYYGDGWEYQYSGAENSSFREVFSAISQLLWAVYLPQNDFFYSLSRRV